MRRVPSTTINETCVQLRSAPSHSAVLRLEAGGKVDTGLAVLYEIFRNIKNEVNYVTLSSEPTSTTKTGSRNLGAEAGRFAQPVHSLGHRRENRRAQPAVGRSALPTGDLSSRRQWYPDADASYRTLQRVLVERGHDVTRTPCEWMSLDAGDEQQLLAVAPRDAAFSRSISPISCDFPRNTRGTAASWWPSRGTGRFRI